MKIGTLFGFEAAHILPHHGGKCSRPHGHSYRLEVVVEGPLQHDGPATGMVMDFGDVKAVVRRLVIETLDHNDLNAVIPNPTAEEIVTWIWGRLEPELPNLRRLVLWETASAYAALER
ncbi:MAG TPA: 6-carboxytetrahydropterin synthase QueD [Candidatus Dormibacteraeota bacterium]|nr:6-carboxytetrahydropterin synthase QueD [Candidatus Dormibacteraeota bacterium]